MFLLSMTSPLRDTGALQLEVAGSVSHRKVLEPPEAALLWAKYFIPTAGLEAWAPVPLPRVSSNSCVS